MPKLYNLARVTTASTGTGTLTLGPAVSGYLTFPLAGVVNGDVVAYGIKDGADSETGSGTIGSSGTTLSRTPTNSTNGGAAIALSGSAEVYITARKEDILNAADPLTSAQIAAQSDMETATSTTLAVPPGRQHFHPGHPKAAYSATITPTAVPGAATSTDTTAETQTWTVAHGLTTGDTVIIASLPPTGLTTLTPYYVNVVSTTVISYHLTLADALAGTSKINLTAHAATTLRKFVHTAVVSYGMGSQSPVSGVAATAAIGLVFNLSPSFSSAAVACFMMVKGLDAVGGGYVASIASMAYPTTIAAGVVTYANAGLVVTEDGSALALTSIWSTQSTNPFNVTFAAWGDL